MTKRKIENSATLKYQNKTFKVHKKKGKYMLSPLVKLHTTKLKTPKMTIRKIEDFGISKYQNKKLSKFTRRIANTLFPPL
jgi:hypothetical protein